MLNAGMFSTERDDWRTPRDLFSMLNDEFHFTLDAASTDENALCAQHFTEKENGLAQRWCGSVWLNPPYGKELPKWLKKASETKEGGVVVCLVPARTETRWWHDYARKATEIRFFKGRLHFDDEKGAAPFGSALLIFDDRPSPWWRVLPQKDT